MRLRAGVRTIWRGPSEVQIGTDPRWAVVLTDLSPAAAHVLATAPAGCTDLELRERWDADGVGAAEVEGVLAHLRVAALLVPEPASPGRFDPADLRVWSLLAEGGDAGGLVERRASARVRLVGLGRLGSSLAALLAAAGIGALELADEATVGADDLGFGGLAPRHLGLPRPAAVARAVHDLRPTIRTGPPGPAPVDLVVLVEQHVADPLRHHPLQAADQPHLSVLRREASVVVGPLVLPGRTTCLHCLDLHRTDLDPGWPTVAAQLAVGPTTAEETLLAHLGAGLAAAQVLAHVDGRPVTVHGCALEVSLPTAVPTRTDWAPHRSCRCGAALV